MDIAHPSASLLGTGSARADVDLVLATQDDGLALVGEQADAIAAAADLYARTILRGGRVRYAGAGTSGWLAALDAAETAMTFGVARQVGSIVAGGLALDPLAMTQAEDDEQAAIDEVDAQAIGAGDLVLAVTASGSTPFTIAAAKAARARGAHVVAVVNRRGSPVEALAAIAICVPTPPEVVAGSTRLAAGLVQKAVLNTLSTVALARAGRTYRGQMVGVDAANDKLRARLVAGVAAATEVSVETARATLDRCDGRGDVAVVALVAGVHADEAAARLGRAGGSIAAALADA